MKITFVRSFFPHLIDSNARDKRSSVSITMRRTSIGVHLRCTTGMIAVTYDFREKFSTNINVTVIIIIIRMQIYFTHGKLYANKQRRVERANERTTEKEKNEEESEKRARTRERAREMWVGMVVAEFK